MIDVTGGPFKQCEEAIAGSKVHEEWEAQNREAEAKAASKVLEEWEAKRREAKA